MSTKNKIDKNYLINIIEEILLNDGISGLSIRKVATKANISIGGVQYISKHNDNEEFDKISKIITILLQEKFVFEGLQDWYSTSLNSIDTNTDEGKKLRLAFLFSEAMFTLMTLKYINISPKEQKEIFEDLKTFLL